MAYRSNMHTHSTYADGKNAPAEMAEAALKLGFHTLGFSEHGPATYDDCAMTPAGAAAYRAEIGRLQLKYAGRLHILLGIERDWLSGLSLEGYRYAVESVHYVPAGGALVCVDDTRERLEAGIREHFGGDPYRFCRDYFRAVAESCAGGARILGHMELVMKFNERRDLFDDADSRYLRYALEAADCAGRSGMLIEINTGAIARGWRTEPCPGPAILRHLAALNAPVMLSSDCHDARFLTCAFDRAEALARACGFREVWEAVGDGYVSRSL